MSQPSLQTIRKKVEDGVRLSAAEGEYLFRDEVDLHAIGELADLVRRRKHGNRAFYNINAHINPTNVCIYRCPLCAYSRDVDDVDAYVLSDEQLAEQARQAAAAGCTELHVVGGVHPDKPYEWYLEVLRVLRFTAPRLHLKAYTAIEIEWLSRISGRSVRSVLEDLIRAGLNSLPGGGAEIFDQQIRTVLCPRKPDARSWLSIHRAAHQLGLRSNATMLYGHVESAEHRIDHLVQLRQLQDVTGGFQAFVPLSFHPQNTAMPHLPRPSPLLDLRTIAISRLMLDNFQHIKAYWISLGLGTAQAALAYGADDLDGTVRQERIHHAAGSETPEVLAVDELRRLIEEAGCRPVERDSLYRPVRRDGATWHVVAEPDAAQSSSAGDTPYVFSPSRNDRPGTVR